MNEINTILQLENIIKQKDKQAIYVSAKWCVDCKVTEFNLDFILSENKINDLYKLDYDKFKIFADEYNIKHLPSVVIVKDYEVISILGTGKSLSPNLIVEFLNKSKR